MTDWFHYLPVVWMTVVVLCAISLVAGGIYWAVMALATGERARGFKTISPVMLTPLSVVFGLLVGFLAAQVWNEAQQANGAVTREAIGLRTVVLLAPRLPGELPGRLRGLVRRHIQQAVSQEWPAMARQEATLKMIPVADTEALELIFSIFPQGEGQALVQREIAAALQSVFEARRQRIIISRANINWVKWTVVLVLIVLILLTIALVHSDNRLAAAIAMAIFVVGATTCVVLIASHSRPFTGQISVGPDLLLQVMPEQ